jgi:hypothetical protein
MTGATRVIAFVTLSVLMLAGCARAAQIAETPVPDATPQLTPTASSALQITASPGVIATEAATVASTSSSPSGNDLPRPVDVVRRHLAQSLNIEPSEITVDAVEETVWPDTCLGLPAPELCVPGSTPGFQIKLKALGQEYTYHTDEVETFRYAGPGDVPQRP